LFKILFSTIGQTEVPPVTQIVMAMKVRNDVLPFWTGVDATMLTRASKLVSAATSFPVQYNKAIVGRNAFAHESGIHQDGMLKHTQTYEIMTPESVGVKQTSLVMGKHSGRHAFIHKLKDLGYEVAGNRLEDAFVRFKAPADRKKHVYDEDIDALVDAEIHRLFSTCDSRGHELQTHGLRAFVFNLEISRHCVRPDVQGMRLAGMAILQHP
jgi:isopropylmalate/homocitrate/citramalate synthase